MTQKSTWQPLDRLAIVLILCLSLLIALLVWGGERSAPRVRNFSWQGKEIGAEDTAFILTFVRPMDHASVEANLETAPFLPGKISWAGRRMAYTLENPAPYGVGYEVKLANAFDRYTTQKNRRKTIQPFVGQFRSRDRAFAYIGVKGEEEGRLVVYNLTRKQKQILTPANWVVLDFEPYPSGRRVLFSAIDRQALQNGSLDQGLYTVTTNIYSDSNNDPETETTRSPEVVQLLDSKVYQNLQFDLAPNGEFIVVQRVNKQKPGEFGLWLIEDGKEPRPLKTQPGGEFMITPDSQTIAIAQGQGMAIIPVYEPSDRGNGTAPPSSAGTAPAKDEADSPQLAIEPLEFLPKFGKVLDFARDGSAATMVMFNTDYTRSLFLVTNQGQQTELFKTTGSIIQARFAPNQKQLFCLLTELLGGETYREQPYLAMIDLETSKVVPLLLLPEQQGIEISLAPDGLALLFDQTLASNTESPALADAPRTKDGRAIADSRLWLLPIDPTLISSKVTPQELPQPEDLTIPGFYPRWIP